MKRSQINQYINEAVTLFHNHSFFLPPFAYWTPADWNSRGAEAAEIRHNGLGWDVTDYGTGDFLRQGLLLFTIRNGNVHRASEYPKGYAEKIMVVREGQVTPWHYHWNKREDIINRGGGKLVLELSLSDRNKEFSRQPFCVSIDGVRKHLSSGDTVTLRPGESICLEPFVYHTFYGKAGTGTVLVGEVSDVNDDTSDNCFYESVGRFPEIEEDVLPDYLLCTEYPEPG